LIVVCGEALIDLVDSPDGQQRGTPGGGPFTTARALARLAIPTEFLGRLSTDAFGQQLRDLLAADGADLSLTSFGPEPTTMAMADVDRDGHAAYRFVIDGTSAPNLTPQMLPSLLSPEVDALHIGTLGLVFEPIATTIAGLVEREHENRLVMVDPNIRPATLNAATGYRTRLDRVISQSTIVKASDADVAWLYPDVDLESAARALLARGPRLVVVTLGADGAFGVSAGIEVRVKAPVVDVVDTIGAGDAFGAGLLAWLCDHDRLTRDLHLEHEELRAALEFACLVASITCTRAGADPPRRAELSLR
jgi:fructokinase